MMDLERWRQIDELLQAALEREPAERFSFLAEACSLDENLKKEVESLLSPGEQALNLIHIPAFEMAAGLLSEHIPELIEGQLVGHYRILSFLSQGGMGEVYLAQDEMLGRKVALKLLPADYTRNKDRVRRFQQEAQAASALNHPNILTIHELGEVDGRQFIATEFVDGETLRQRLKREALTLPEALDIAIQIASALSSAHQEGIVHRDIKPENVMLRPDGYVKLLDFGLAKLTEHNERSPATRAVETTDHSSGLLLGTVKYMSPEQARGMSVDARSDIFSFGVVIYEMVASRAPFEGETTTQLLASILNDDPIPAATAPDELQNIVRKALVKDRGQRYPAIEDLLADLRSLKNSLELLRAEVLITQSGRHKSRALAMVALLFFATLSVGYVTYKAFASKRAASSGNIELAWMTTSGKVAGAAVSPDGRYVGYVLGNEVWTRNVATNSQVKIMSGGQDDCWGLTFSRDGNFLYYFADLKSDDEAPALYRIPAVEGVPSKLIANIPDDASPVTFSPDGAHLAFVRQYPGETALIVANVDGTDERKLAARHSPAYFRAAAWSPDGKSIACTGASKDDKTLHEQLTEIGFEDGVGRKIAAPEFFHIGDIVWVADGSALLLTAQDREGQPIQVWEVAYPTATVRRISADLNSYAGLSLTADSHALVTVRIQTTMNIWTQPANGGEAKQITSGPALKDGIAGLAWTPNGRIVYSSNASGRDDIWIMNSDGSIAKQLTLDLGTDRLGLSVSPDGRYVVFVSNRRGASNIWRIDIDGSNPKQLTNGGGEFNPVFSADGQWVTYTSPDSRNSIPWKVPVDGGAPIMIAGQDTSVDPHLLRPLRVSPDGSLVAYDLPSDNPTNGKKVGIASMHGDDPIRLLDLPTGAWLQRLRWTPDGQALSFIDNRGSPNIWSQPLNGSRAKQLTDFKNGNIFNFDWSRDGKYLAIVRRSSSSDVVMMKNFR